MSVLDIEIIKTRLRYDHEDGQLRWLNGRLAGSIAGSSYQCKRTSYKTITINGVKLRAHRAAWALFYGAWPDGQIDHIDGNGLNNRIDNLRVVSNRQNRLNSRRPNTNKSGVTGVYLRTESTSWRAQIYNNGKKVILGDTPDFFEAVCMRKSAERSLGYHLNHDKI